MNTDTTKAPLHGQSRGAVFGVKGLARFAVAMALTAVLLFAPAGRWDWGMGWACLGVLATCVCVNIIVLKRVNPEVIAERLRGTEGAKTWDLALSSVMGVFVLATLVVAGLDERFGWSPHIALSLQIGGLLVVVLGNLVFLWTMAVNKFCSKLVRVEPDRGHYVVTAGPYRYVRHPGYVGWTLMWGILPLVLGSLWAFVPAALVLGLILVRTALEDKTLKEELDGYEAYARQVRHRLVPGVW